MEMYFSESRLGKPSSGTSGYSSNGVAKANTLPPGGICTSCSGGRGGGSVTKTKGVQVCARAGLTFPFFLY